MNKEMYKTDKTGIILERIANSLHVIGLICFAVIVIGFIIASNF